MPESTWITTLFTAGTPHLSEWGPDESTLARVTRAVRAVMERRPDVEFAEAESPNGSEVWRIDRNGVTRKRETAGASDAGTDASEYDEPACDGHPGFGDLTEYCDGTCKPTRASAQPDDEDLDDCTCIEFCDQDPATACSLSGTPHVHPEIPGHPGVYGPCPVHPGRPGDH